MQNSCFKMNTSCSSKFIDNFVEIFDSLSMFVFLIGIKSPQQTIDFSILLCSYSISHKVIILGQPKATWDLRLQLKTKPQCLIWLNKFQNSVKLMWYKMIFQSYIFSPLDLCSNCQNLLALTWMGRLRRTKISNQTLLPLCRWTCLQGDY